MNCWKRAWRAWMGRQITVDIKPSDPVTVKEIHEELLKLRKRTGPLGFEDKS